VNGQRPWAFALGIVLALSAQQSLAQKNYNPQTWVLGPDKQKRLVHARPGTEVSFVRVFVSNQACESQPVVIRIVQPPAHGRAYICPEEMVQALRLPGSTNCIGHRLQGVGVWYMPENGLPPEDSFEYEVTASGRTTHVTGIVKFEDGAPPSPPSKCNQPAA
jgi:hypothetical protein